MILQQQIMCCGKIVCVVSIYWDAKYENKWIHCAFKLPFYLNILRNFSNKIRTSYLWHAMFLVTHKKQSVLFANHIHHTHTISKIQMTNLSNSCSHINYFDLSLTNYQYKGISVAKTTYFLSGLPNQGHHLSLSSSSCPCDVKYHGSLVLLL